MDGISYIINNSRIARHTLFWITWVVGFTFVKSFGQGLDIYLGWFIYYIVTLPIFLSHTYIIVYWMGKLLSSWSRILLFLFLFIVLLCIFSILELIVSHILLAKWFPNIFSAANDFLSFGNVLISGIGNLYIIIVFVAMKMIRFWYLSTEEKKSLSNRLLENRVAKANLKIQPGLLIYATSMMEQMAERNSKTLSPSIAQLSEIINQTMIIGERRFHRLEEEIILIRNLLRLHAKFDENEMISIEVQDLRLLNSVVPVLVLFSAIEIGLRRIRGTKKIDIGISAPNEPFKAIITWNLGQRIQSSPSILAIIEEMSQFFPDHYCLIDSGRSYQYILEIHSNVKRSG